MYFPLDAKSKNLESKLSFSAKAAASLVYMLNKQRDATGLSVFSNDLEIQTPARSAGVHMAMLYAELEKLMDTPWDQKQGETNAAKSLHIIAEAVHKRSLVVIFSDMFDNGTDTEQIFSALQHLKHNKHEVILFHVTDKEKELNFDYDNRPYKFVDMESGEEIKLQPEQVKEKYLQHIQEFTQELKLRCAQYHIDFVDADINQGYSQVLLPYLMKRTNMRV